MGIMSIKEFQKHLEDYVWKGYLPLMATNKVWLVKQTYESYETVDNKAAKRALLVQLAEGLMALRLNNPTKRFDKTLEEIGIRRDFTQALLKAYPNRLSVDHLFKMESLESQAEWYRDWYLEGAFNG
jgi:hypothetical protein